MDAAANKKSLAQESPYDMTKLDIDASCTLEKELSSLLGAEAEQANDMSLQEQLEFVSKYRPEVLERLRAEDPVVQSFFEEIESLNPVKNRANPVAPDSIGSDISLKELLSDAVGPSPKERESELLKLAHWAWAEETFGEDLELLQRMLELSGEDPSSVLHTMHLSPNSGKLVQNQAVEIPNRSERTVKPGEALSFENRDILSL